MSKTQILDVMPVWEWWIFGEYQHVSEEEENERVKIALWYAMRLNNWFDSKANEADTELFLELGRLRIAKSTDGKNTFWLTYQYL